MSHSPRTSDSWMCWMPRASHIDSSTPHQPDFSCPRPWFRRNGSSTHHHLISLPNLDSLPTHPLRNPGWSWKITMLISSLPLMSMPRSLRLRRYLLQNKESAEGVVMMTILPKMWLSRNQTRRRTNANGMMARGNLRPNVEAPDLTTQANRTLVYELDTNIIILLCIFLIKQKSEISKAHFVVLALRVSFVKCTLPHFQ